MVKNDPSLRKTESAVESGTAGTSNAPTGGGRAMPEIGPGDCLGRYTVRSLIGAGGMGRVFAATDSELGRTVALKVIRPDRVASSYARARLLREAQALAQLHHPNVVTVHDVGAEGDNVFIAMELIDGQTLGNWLRAEPRAWPAIRDVFLAAGRGLAAAHAAGIVHRDFKPHNVIVGADRVVVVDFGVARAEIEPEEPGDAPTPAPGEGLHLALTLTGERIGTPHYMAPEQRAGDVVTAQGDQFAFCVALHEALFDRRPGEGVAASADRRVPRFVTAAIARGLALCPEDRWPSMDALLAELGRTFWTRRRKRMAGVAAAAVVTAIAVAGFTIGQRAAAAEPCVDGDALVAPLWDDATRTAVRDAFQRTGRSYAGSTFDRVDARLRERVAGWARSYRDNCEATHVRHEQSEAMLDLRAQCLGRARTELSALIALLAHADGAVVERATRAAGEVGDLGRCSDPAALGAGIPAPPPLLAGPAAAMRDELARISPLFDLGKWKEASASAQDLVGRARRLGYKPLLAKALAHQAHIEANTGAVDQAIADLYEVAELGTEVGDDDVVATVLPWLVFTLGYGRDRFDAADVVYRWATAAVARAGNTPVKLAGLYGNRATVLGRQGDHDGALKLYQTLLGLETTRRGPESIGVAWAHRSIAEELVALGHSADARPHFQRAADMIEKLLGPDHPLLAAVLSSYGWDLGDLAEFDKAVQVFQRSIAIFERSVGPDDLRVAATLYNLSTVLIGQRRLPETRAALERAIAIHHAKEPAEGRTVAQEYDVLGDVARLEGKPAEAVALVERALAIKLKVLGPEHEETGITYRILADHLAALGRTKDARAAIDKAMAIDDKAHPKEHPEVGTALVVQGDVLRAEHKPREAVAAYERALQTLEKSYGATGIALCQPLSHLSAALLETGDARRAHEVAQRALTLAGRAAPGELETAQVRLAQAQWALAQDRPGALALARQARAGLAALPFPAEELPRLDRWLATVK